MTYTMTAVVQPIELGQSIPPDTAHAISVSLPTWKACVGYEEGEEWVLSKMKQAYPRFYIHQSIASFAEAILVKHGRPNERAMLFPSTSVATRCVDFLIAQSSINNGQISTGPQEQTPVLTKGKDVYLVEFEFQGEELVSIKDRIAVSTITAVLFPENHFNTAKAFWQHSGDGISSRRAEFYHKAFEEGHLISRSSFAQQASAVSRTSKGPRRYQKDSSINKQLVSDPGFNDPTSAGSKMPEKKDYVQFVEERFGRNLDASLAANAKLAIRRRIAGSLTADVDLREALDISRDSGAIRKVTGFSEKDVYLYPTGMSSIFNIHQLMLATRGPLESISYGFPYIDTLKILEKWGPGCLFYGHGSSTELDDLQNRCEGGYRFLALFCEFPGNPMLKSPNLYRIRLLANRFDFAVVVDETIGNFMNVHVLPFADVVVSSLTKVFSGDSNVMGGSAVLNPHSRYYRALKETLAEEYQDNYWAGDALFMERNSRDFVARIERININAEAMCQALISSPLVKEVYYPKHSPTRPFYDACRTPNGGYGGLLSVTFHSTAAAVIFFDAIEIAKGPSLGTNFTLCSPYTLLAHYGELDWAAQFGVEADLVRISVGLEDTNGLVQRIERVLAVMEESGFCL